MGEDDGVRVRGRMGEGRVRVGVTSETKKAASDLAAAMACGVVGTCSPGRNSIFSGWNWLAYLGRERGRGYSCKDDCESAREGEGENDSGRHGWRTQAASCARSVQ